MNDKILWFIHWFKIVIVDSNPVCTILDNTRCYKCNRRVYQDDYYNCITPKCPLDFIPF